MLNELLFVLSSSERIEISILYKQLDHPEYSYYTDYQNQVSVSVIDTKGQTLV